MNIEKNEMEEEQLYSGTYEKEITKPFNVTEKDGTAIFKAVKLGHYAVIEPESPGR